MPLHASVAVNLFCGACSALLQLLCIPWWINHIGMERFGLFGIHVTITALVQIFDLGLSPSVTTRIAMADTGARSIFSAAMTVAIAVACMITLIIFAMAPMMSGFLGENTLAHGETVNALRWSGAAASLQIPLNVGLAGLAGLEMHATSGLLRLVVSLLANLGGLTALVLIAPRIDTLLACMAVATALGGGTVWWFVNTRLKFSTEPYVYGFQALRSLIRFSAHMVTISAIGALAAYLDRIVLGSTLTLQRFGMYSLAATVAFSIRLVVAPLHSAIFSRFAARISQPEQLQKTYLLASAVLTTAIAPFLATMAVMPYAILLVWTNKPELALSAAAILRWLGVGMALNGLMHVPFALLISKSSTKIPLVASAIFLLVISIGLILIGSVRGGEGAAWVWAACGAVYILSAAPLAHHTLSQGTSLRFFTISLGGSAAAVLSALLIATVLPQTIDRSTALFTLGVTGITAMASSAIVSWRVLQKT